MFTLQGVSYSLPNKEVLFQDIDLTVETQEKIALVGNNGVGKSTLLKIIAQQLTATAGFISLGSRPYFIPQIFGQYNELSVAGALGIGEKLEALESILNGNLTEENYAKLADDWTIEDRCREALAHWKLEDLALSQKLDSLSGGQKTRVFLSGIFIHRPELILMDEPSNHLDSQGRQLLYDFIQSTKSTVVIVSHDRKLLNILSQICELTPGGIKTYGGGFDFYSSQKQVELLALEQDIQSKERALQKAKIKERETLQRQNKLDNRGKGKQKKAGVARIMMNTLKNKAENSTSKSKQQHAEKIEGISDELSSLRSSLPDSDKMKFGFDNSSLHTGKTLFKAEGANYSYGDQLVWKPDLGIEIKSGERIAIKGQNGSGKTTLIKLILGNLEPVVGKVKRAESKSVYIDQEYSILNRELNIYEQCQEFNSSALKEHEIKIRLHRFMFSKENWDKPVASLSGGERMRLVLCCLTISALSPDLIVLDEPTNNLDIQNIEILTAAIREFQGTLIVVSHDETFLKEVNIHKEVHLFSI